ncbi:5-hydroxytryptamine receptor 2C-like [Dreissena polymorpha]|uniref:5-hydroxytryptamine receptor 2C-like n=1 Tax=Dreissena polymorpha TaxID=45954 RepID=UPI00226496FB|nr:5-hydroxytryptamine receptor 2C-like [Dreissena polymorpha]
MANLTAEDLNGRIVREIWWVSVFIGLEIVAGLIGNVIVLYVFGRHYHHCNFRYFVLCIAYIHILSVCTIMPAEIVNQLYWYVYPLHESVCKIKAYLNLFTVAVEVFCLCTVAIDRYRKMCAPHGWQIRPVHAFRICVIIVVIAAVISTPVPVLWGLQTLNVTNVKVTVCEKDERFLKTGIHQNYISGMSAIVVSAAIITILLYFTLYFRVHRTFFEQKHRFKSGRTVSRNVPNESIETNDNVLPDANDLIMKRKSDDTKTNVETSEDYSSHVPDDNNVIIHITNQPKNSADSVQLENVQNVSTRHKPEIGPNANEENMCDIMNSTSLEVKSKRTFNKQVRLRRTTKVTLTLSIIFSLTFFLYAGMHMYLGKDDQKLHYMSDSNKGLFFFGLS